MSEPDATRATPRELPAWLGAGLVALVALGLRAWHWSELRAHDPFFELPAVDGAYYHAWARAIAEGDWLGENVFHNGPLYPYLLGLLYALVGPSVALAKLAQVVLGTLCCLVVWGAARRLFDARVALLAGLLMACHELSIFYAGTLLLVNVALPLTALAIYCAVRLQERPGLPLAWGSGLVIGLGVLARPNMLLFGLGLLVWLPWALRPRPLLRRALLTGGVGLGMALAVLPATLRNGLLSDDWVLVTSSGGMNLFMGNNPDANGLYRVPRPFNRATTDDVIEQNAAFARYAERTAGRTLRASEVSGFWRAQALGFIRSHPGPWLRLELRKLEHATNAFEPWNVRSVTLSRDFSQVLRLPLLGLGVLLPLAALGAVLCWRDWRRLLPVYLVLGTILATLLAFFVTARYRLPAVPALAILAAAGCVKGVEAIASRRYRILAAGLAVAAAVAWNAQRALATDDLSIAYYNLGNRYRALGRPEEAVQAYLEVLARRPRYISAYNNLALAFEELARAEEAVTAWQAVLVLARAEGSQRHIERATRHLQTLGAEIPEPQSPEP